MVTSDTRQEAINACQDCYIVCQEVLAYHGDEEGGKQLSSQHIKRMIACIELCRTTASMLAIRAPLLDRLCEICAQICEQCATSCKARDNAYMKECAQVCQHCCKALLEESHHIKQVA